MSFYKFMCVYTKKIKTEHITVSKSPKYFSPFYCLSGTVPSPLPKGPLTTEII